MNEQDRGDAWITHNYETALCLALTAAAFLWRDNPELTYPAAHFLLVLLLAVSGGTGALLRRGLSQPQAAAAVLLQCGVVTALLEHSGGERSNLWVLYLLPVFTASLLLRPREAAWVTAGTAAFGAGYHVLRAGDAWAAGLFALGLKSSLLVFAGAATVSVSSRGRAARRALETQRAYLEKLEARAGDSDRRLAASERAIETGWLAAGAAHDLGSSLTVVLGTAQLLLADDAVPPQVRVELLRVARAAQLSLRIASELVSTARSAELSLAPTDVNDLLRGSLSMAGGILARAGVSLCSQLEEMPLRAAVSAPHLQRVFANLIANAIHAMPKGGRLTARTRWVGPELQVIFEDTGPGIPQEALARLFQPLASTRQAEGGTGLGLFVSRQIVGKHGGRLQAENRPEGGARFIVTLPACEAVRGVGLNGASPSLARAG